MNISQFFSDDDAQFMPPKLRKSLSHVYLKDRFLLKKTDYNCTQLYRSIVQNITYLADENCYYDPPTVSEHAHTTICGESLAYLMLYYYQRLCLISPFDRPHIMYHYETLKITQMVIATKLSIWNQFLRRDEILEQSRYLAKLSHFSISVEEISGSVLISFRLPQSKGAEHPVFTNLTENMRPLMEQAFKDAISAHLGEA